MVSEHPGCAMKVICAMANISTTCDSMNGRMARELSLLEGWLQSMPTCDIVSLRMTTELFSTFEI